MYVCYTAVRRSYWGEVQLLSSQRLSRAVAGEGEQAAKALVTPAEALLQKLLMGKDELLGQLLDFMVAGMPWKRVRHFIQMMNL